MPKKAIEEVKEKSNAGRKTKYCTEMSERALDLSLLGYTNEEIAKSLEIADSTFDLWMVKHEGFSGAIKEGRDLADGKVAAKLFRRAMGYRIKKQKVMNDGSIIEYEEEIPSETIAGIYWLNNRQRKNWRNRTSIEDQDGNPVTMVKVVNYEDHKKDKKPNGANDSA